MRLWYDIYLGSGLGLVCTGRGYHSLMEGTIERGKRIHQDFRSGLVSGLEVGSGLKGCESCSDGI